MGLAIRHGATVERDRSVFRLRWPPRLYELHQGSNSPAPPRPRCLERTQRSSRPASEFGPWPRSLPAFRRASPTEQAAKRFGAGDRRRQNACRSTESRIRIGERVGGSRMCCGPKDNADFHRVQIRGDGLFCLTWVLARKIAGSSARRHLPGTGWIKRSGVQPFARGSSRHPEYQNDRIEPCSERSL